MGYKSKFKGEEIEVRLENIYFYTVPLDLVRKIDDREPLTVKEALSLYDAILQNYRLVFRYNLISEGSRILFHHLADSGYTSSNVSPDNPSGVQYFVLMASSVHYNVVTGVLELSSDDTLMFTYRDGYFEVS